MMKFVCKKCGYRFESEKENSNCPYCGKKEIEGEKNAGELIKDVEKILN